VLIGIFIGCAIFAVSASRVDVVKFSFDGTDYRSSLDRGPEALKIRARALSLPLTPMQAVTLGIRVDGWSRHCATPRSPRNSPQFAGGWRFVRRRSSPHKAMLPTPCISSSEAASGSS
jgi:hypothetical protein